MFASTKELGLGTWSREHDSSPRLSIMLPQNMH